MQQVPPSEPIKQLQVHQRRQARYIARSLQDKGSVCQ